MAGSHFNLSYLQKIISCRCTIINYFWTVWIKCIVWSQDMTLILLTPVAHGNVLNPDLTLTVIAQGADSQLIWNGHKMGILYQQDIKRCESVVLWCWYCLNVLYVRYKTSWIESKWKCTEIFAWLNLCSILSRENEIIHIEQKYRACLSQFVAFLFLSV